MITTIVITTFIANNLSPLATLGAVLFLTGVASSAALIQALISDRRYAAAFRYMEMDLTRGECAAEWE